MLTADQIFIASFVYLWLSCIWELYLSTRQYRKQVATLKPPPELREILDVKKFSKARAYKLDVARFGFAHDIVDHLQTSMILLYNLIPALWALAGYICNRIGLTGEIYQSIWVVGLGMVIFTLLDLPLSYVRTFVIEERHGFNKQTLPFFIKDTIKKTLVCLVITSPTVAVIVWTVKRKSDYNFWETGIFLSIIMFLLMTIYPEVIAPLFDKYTLLPEGELKDGIEKLAARIAYPLKKIFVVEGSKRSSHSNAYLYGIWKNKRIVLYDTLLAEPRNREEVPKDEKGEQADDETDAKGPNKEAIGMCNEEVLAVVGHELGHWKLWHNTYNLIIMEVSLFAHLAVFAWLYKQPILYNAFGFHDEYPVVIGLGVIQQFILAPVTEFLNVMLVAFTRRMEFAADRFSADLGLSQWMKSALIKLSRDNLIFPVDDWLYSAWHHNHPSVPERLEALSKFD